jgi:hypothetical protein
VELISTPLILDVLNSEAAVFVGTNHNEKTVQSWMGGEIEVTQKFPYLQLSRENWEALGMPTVLQMALSEVTVTT